MTKKIAQVEKKVTLNTEVFKKLDKTKVALSDKKNTESKLKILQGKVDSEAAASRRATESK